MSEETTPSREELEAQADTVFRVESVGEGNVPIKDAERLRLVVESDPLIIAALSELVMAYMQMFLGGEVIGALDDKGNDLTSKLRPEVIDPLSTGDDPVA